MYVLFYVMEYLNLTCISFSIYTLIFYVKNHIEATCIPGIFIYKKNFITHDKEHVKWLVTTELNIYKYF
jgi:hypothetical protein